MPAEEYIELDYRKSLRDEGKIRFYAGKAELAYRGAYDDVDMCVMAHNFPIEADGYKCAPMNTGNGFIGKKTHFLGKQSHAGAAPWDGVNALNMAVIAINSMHAQRETFKDMDCVRIHQIINRGGDIVNAVPDDVELETTVRARNLTALRDANDKVNRCIRGAAIAMGGTASVEDSPGQMPLAMIKPWRLFLKIMPFASIRRTRSSPAWKAPLPLTSAICPCLCRYSIASLPAWREVFILRITALSTWTTLLSYR